MLLRTKLITTGVVAATTIIGGLQCLNFDGQSLAQAIEANKKMSANTIEMAGKVWQAADKQQQDLTDKNKYIKELEANKIVLEGQIKDLENQIENTAITHQQAIDKLTQEKQDLENQMKDNKIAWEKAQAEVNRLNDQIKKDQVAHQQAIDKLVKEKQEFENQMKDNKIALEKAQAEVNRLTEALKIANETIKSKENELKNYTDAYKHEYDEVRKANDFVKEQLPKVEETKQNIMDAGMILEQAIGKIQGR